MRTAHTPGPWELDFAEDVDLPNHVGISADRHSLLAQVVWKMEDDERTPRCEATARLIAEAPAMYDLLMRAADVIEALDGTSIENEKLVDDYRAWGARCTTEPYDPTAKAT